MLDFEGYFEAPPEPEAIAPGAFVLRGFAQDEASELLSNIEAIAERHPFRHMEIPGGFPMAAAMTNCGAAGWVADRRGYRYQAEDPLSGEAWPPLPPLFRSLSKSAAAAAGYPDFDAQACLINRYLPAAGMSLHQDKDEQDLSAPIVSVSLGLPIIFLFGGLDKKIKVRRIALDHGDVVVWGGRSRLAYHGVAPLKEGTHPLLGRMRINLTFRKIR